MKVALGVTGGVAAYKAAELVRRLQQERLDVLVVMTRSATEFVTPLTFAALTGQKVITGMFEEAAGGPANVESAIEHIAVAQRIRLLLVAPATANTIARFANGIADDFLSTLYLATTAPVILAPAMNVNMWNHAATQENLARLRARGVRIVEPDEGYLACGMTGPGRLAGTDAIVQAVREVLGLRHDFDGETVLVTAGPTLEDIDPVRYLGNRSSGRMGYALAGAAARRGAKVVLVSGPTQLDTPDGVERVDVRSAEEMRRAVLDRGKASTVVIKAAAVADFRPAAPQAQKIKRGKSKVALELEPTPDILAELGKMKNGLVLVGFAAETESVADNARAKLREKGADVLVANDVTRPGAGFDSETNVVTIFTRDGGQVDLPQLTKSEVADRVLDEVARLRRNSK
jgi:phosphopantothenoylcysteine decarboxylase/phosphopantothenate--cysteine ligase